MFEPTENMAVEPSNPASEPKYILGHSPAEIRRLMTTQADLLRPTTERLLRAAGVSTGMRVLDLGCGAGDVSILAAELVGPSGSVVGIDRNADVVTAANERARSSGLRNVDFRHAELHAFTSDALFDCVVGRYVLIHQADPANFLRTGAQFLQRNGVIAFHEPDITRSANSSPLVPRLQAVGELLRAAFIDAVPHYDVANRMVEHFLNAGLPTPSMLREIPISTGEHSTLCRWSAETLHSVQPRLIEMGLFPNEEIDVEKVEAKLREAAVAARSVLEGPAQVGAWAWV